MGSLIPKDQGRLQIILSAKATLCVHLFILNSYKRKASRETGVAVLRINYLISRKQHLKFESHLIIDSSDSFRHVLHHKKEIGISAMIILGQDLLYVKKKKTNYQLKWLRQDYLMFEGSLNNLRLSQNKT